MIKELLNWEDVNLNWEDVNMNWEDIHIIKEVERVVRGSGLISDYVKNNPWNKLRKTIGEEKTKKFITIFCKINDISYEEIKEEKDIKIKVDQFERVFQSVPKISLKK